MDSFLHNSKEIKYMPLSNSICEIIDLAIADILS